MIRVCWSSASGRFPLAKSCSSTLLDFPGVHLSAFPAPTDCAFHPLSQDFDRDRAFSLHTELRDLCRELEARAGEARKPHPKLDAHSHTGFAPCTICTTCTAYTIHTGCPQPNESKSRRAELLRQKLEKRLVPQLQVNPGAHAPGPPHAHPPKHIKHERSRSHIVFITP